MKLLHRRTPSEFTNYTLATATPQPDSTPTRTPTPTHAHDEHQDAPGETRPSAPDQLGDDPGSGGRLPALRPLHEDDGGAQEPRVPPQVLRGMPPAVHRK